jgi:hypothetical protein
MLKITRLASPPSSWIALRFGATYPANSAYIRARTSTGCWGSIAIRAIPSMGSHPRLANRLWMSCVRRLGVPLVRPPVFLPNAMFNPQILFNDPNEEAHAYSIADLSFDNACFTSASDTS